MTNIGNCDKLLQSFTVNAKKALSDILAATTGMYILLNHFVKALEQRSFANMASI
jgi:hypothetical protein